MSLQKKIEERGYDSDSEDDGSIENTGSRSCSPLHFCAVLFRQLGVFLKLNLKDISSRKVNYCLGLLSCFIVVVVTALMLTVLVRLPVLFLKLGELDKGQLDFRVRTGGDAFRAQSLNYSKVKSDVPLFKTEQYKLHSPRIGFTSSDGMRAFAIEACNFTALDDVWNTTKAAAATPTNFTADCAEEPCVDQFCAVEGNAARTFKAHNWYWIDSVRERTAEMGKKDFPTFGVSDGTIPAGYAVLDQGAANSLKVKVNETFFVTGSVINRLLEAYIQADMVTSITSPYSRFRNVAVPFKVLGIVPDTEGKLGTEATPMILTEYGTTLAHMAAFIAPTLLDSFRKERLAATNPDEFASEIYWNYPPAERFDKYTHSDYSLVLADATTFAGPIVTSLGFNQIDMAVPIVEFMNGTRFFALFLGLIVSIIIVGLGALSIVLVYSLLIVGIQTRQFELGVMRMVGFTRTQLVMYIITGASLFAIPALVLGLVGAQTAFLGVRQVMNQQLEVELPVALTGDAVGFAILAGLAIPVLASISPILEVLAMSLPDALNTQRGRVQAVLYDIKAGDRAPDYTLVIFGVGLSVFGFLIYYLFPLALFSFNLTLLFYIFFALLLGMLFGAILLAMNFDHFAQTFTAYLFFFIEREAVFKLMRSNLIAHRQRNRSNSLMFATAVGFIVFITVSFDIQLQSVTYNNARRMGGELAISPDGRADRTGDFIDFTRMQKLDATFLELMKGDPSKFGGMEWTWVSQDMDFLPGVANATYATLGRYRVFPQTVMNSAAPNFFEVANPEFLITKSEFNNADVKEAATAKAWGGGGKDGGADGAASSSSSVAGDITLSEYLYTREGSGRAVISTYMQDQFGIEGYDGPNDAFQFVLTRPGPSGEQEDVRSLALPMAVLDASPVRVFSKFPRRTGQPTIMSHPSFLMRANGSGGAISIRQLRVYQLTLKCTRAQAKEVSLALATSASLNMKGLDVDVLEDLESNLATASTIVNFFFGFTQAIAMAVCFFALISTMSTNIYEHQKEIGILRAIGAPKSYVTRVFVEEAFVLVFAACLLGTIVGTIVAYTMLIQRALFTQLPLPFQWPVTNIVLMFLLGIAFSFGSTWTPIKAVLNSPSVTHILRKAI